MIFTVEEKCLLNLYRFGSAGETASVVRDALNDITDPNERAAALNLLLKLKSMSDTAFHILDTEDFYDR
jgi:hypothetical protein